MEQSKTKEEVWQTVQAMNRLWAVEGKTEELKEYFHEDMVAITPTDRERREGRDACIAGWKAFVDAAKIHYIKEIDPKIQLYGDGNFAVVTYYYDMSVEMGGQVFNLGGRDMFALVKEGERWMVVADQFSSYPTALRDNR
jgi:hypothetical protein